MLDRELLEQFCAFLDKKIGLHYPQGCWHHLEKKLISINHSLGFDDPAACLNWLMKNPIDKRNLDVLILNLTVGETYFFRDLKLFTALEQWILPEIIHRRRKDKSIKIWSTACCTGEEPYSIAILLHRLIPNLKDWKISILGTDVNKEFLLKAEKAEYKKWSFRTIPPNIIERYFKKNDDGKTFTLIPEIRGVVNFDYLNLVEHIYPDPSKNICEFDLIFCHNVLIYFSKNQIEKTLYHLTESLSDNGWLSTAAIETAFITGNALKTYTQAGAIFFKRELSKTKDYPSLHVVKKPEIVETLPLQFQPPIVSTRDSSANTKKQDALFLKSLHLYQQKTYSEVIALLQPHLAPIQNDPLAINQYSREIVLLTRTYANQGETRLAMEWAERALQADKLNPILHYLRAILLQEQGDIPEAIKSIKNALFIDSNFMMAYFILGILEKQQGNKKAALHSFRVALELLNDYLPEDILPHAEELTVEYLKESISSNLKSLHGIEI